jgi:hypothetical protein
MSATAHRVTIFLQFIFPFLAIADVNPEITTFSSITADNQGVYSQNPENSTMLRMGDSLFFIYIAHDNTDDTNKVYSRGLNLRTQQYNNPVMVFDHDYDPEHPDFYHHQS